MNFISDNQSTVFPEIIDYLQYINKNSVDSYGNDPITIKANKLLRVISTKILMEKKLKLYLLNKYKKIKLSLYGSF